MIEKERFFMKMIVCVSENYGIGKGGELLFSLPPDMKLFRETTMNSVVVMGRATLDSFPGGKPLKNRENIVLTRNKDFQRDGVVVANSEKDVLEKIKEYPDKEVYVIGGEEIYRMFEPYCSGAIVTKVQARPDADKFFFNIDEAPGWRLSEESEIMEHEGTKFCFCRYIKED